MKGMCDLLIIQVYHTSRGQLMLGNQHSSMHYSVSCYLTPCETMFNIME